MTICIEFSRETQGKSSLAPKTTAAIERQDRDMLAHSLFENGKALGTEWLRETLALAGVERLRDMPLPMLRVLAHTVHRAEWLIFLSDQCAAMRSAASAA